MAMAYAVVLVNDELFKHQKRDTVAEAQVAADDRFARIAVENRLTKVMRNPEPRVMTHEELRQGMPYANLDGLTGLYFTADIT
jgi:hypothetical protein